MIFLLGGNFVGDRFTSVFRPYVIAKVRCTAGGRFRQEADDGPSPAREERLTPIAGGADALDSSIPPSRQLW